MTQSPYKCRRIALVVHALHGGGAERLMSELANRWSSAGHDVHLITLDNVQSDRYRVIDSVKRYGLGVMSHSGTWMEALIASRRRVGALRTTLKRIDATLILSFCDRTNILCLTAAKGLGEPVWIAEHSDPRQQILPLRWRLWRRHAYPRASGCVVLTPEIGDWMKQWIPSHKICVIPPAIQLPSKIETTSATEAEQSVPRMNQSDNSQQIVGVGRHSAEKNFQALLRAWIRVESSLPQWRLCLVGDGPEHQALKAEASASGPANRVDMPGWLDDPWESLSKKSIFVLPSHYEGFPVALLEAMSRGLACITAPCCDSVRHLAAIGAVHLVRSNEPSDLADAINQVANDEDLKNELSHRASAVAQQYVWSEVGPLWDSLLDRAAEGA